MDLTKYVCFDVEFHLNVDVEIKIIFGIKIKFVNKNAFLSKLPYQVP